VSAIPTFVYAKRNYSVDGKSSLDIAPNVVLKRCDVFVMRLAMWTIMAVITRMIIMMTKTMMMERMKRIVE
jgi:hypothetical protein